MKPTMLAFVSLVSLSACALDGSGSDDLDTAETTQGLTAPGCYWAVDLSQRTTVSVMFQAANLIANGCTDGAVIEAAPGANSWHVYVDWHGTVGECVDPGWVDASDHVLTPNGWALADHKSAHGIQTSTNPLACRYPTVDWDLPRNTLNRIVDKSYYYGYQSTPPVDSFVIFTPE